LDAGQYSERSAPREQAQQARERISRRTMMMPRLANRDQCRQRVTYNRQAQPREPLRRTRGQFKRQGQHPTPRFVPRPKSSGQIQRRENRNRKGAVLSVTDDNRRREHVGVQAAGILLQPSFRFRHYVTKLFISSNRNAKSRPAKCRRAQVAQTLIRVSPTTVSVGAFCQPVQTEMNCGWRIAVGRFFMNDGERRHGGRRGQRAAGKFADPVPVRRACCQQFMSGSNQCGLQLALVQCRSRRHARIVAGKIRNPQSRTWNAIQP